MTSGDLKQAYEILGAVESTVTGLSLYADTTESKGKSENALRAVAFSKYGDRVDAIINVTTEEGVSGGFWGAFGGGYGAHTGNVHSQGVAVSFKKEPQPRAAAEEAGAQEKAATKKRLKKN